MKMILSIKSESSLFLHCKIVFFEIMFWVLKLLFHLMLLFHFTAFKIERWFQIHMYLYDFLENSF